MCLIALPAAGVVAGSMTSAMLTASVAASVAGAAMSAYGAIQQGKAANAQANYQAAVARNNQVIAERQAEATIDAGRAVESNKRLEMASLAGTARARAAASGIDAGYEAGAGGGNSAADIQESIGLVGEADALTIRSNYARQAYTYQVAGMNAGAEGELALLTGRNALTASRISAFSSVLSGAGSVADKWAGWQMKR